MATVSLRDQSIFTAATHPDPVKEPLLPVSIRQEIDHVRTYMEIGRLSLFKALDPNRTHPALAIHLLRQCLPVWGGGVFQEVSSLIFKRAARSGNLDVLNTLLQAPYNLRPDRDILSAVALSGNVDALNTLLQAPYYRRPDPETLRVAALSGNVDALNTLLQAPYNLHPNQDTLRAAALSGNVDVLNTLLQAPYKLRPDQGTLNAAAWRGSADVLDTLLKAPYNLQPNQNTVSTAAQSGNPLALELCRQALNVAERIHFNHHVPWGYVRV